MGMSDAEIIQALLLVAWCVGALIFWIHRKMRVVRTLPRDRDGMFMHAWRRSWALEAVSHTLAGAVWMSIVGVLLLGSRTCRAGWRC